MPVSVRVSVRPWGYLLFAGVPGDLGEAEGDARYALADLGRCRTFGAECCLVRAFRLPPECLQQVTV